MGSYVQISCDPLGCDFAATIGNATEFYVDPRGVERLYGHPVCLSREAEQCGIAGFWRDLLCWNCGRFDRESVKLPEADKSRATAWWTLLTLPGPPIVDHPRSCPDCEGILCDIDVLRMFLDYRSDPQVAHAELARRLQDLRAVQAEYPDLCKRIRERRGDPAVPLEAEMKDLQKLRTDDEAVLCRLGIVPRLPVCEASVKPLRDALTAANQTAEVLRGEVSARVEQSRSAIHDGRSIGKPADRAYGNESAESAGDEDERCWDAAMRAGATLGSKLEGIRELKTHLWVAKQLLQDERGAMQMFRHRCPRCKAEPLRISRFDT